jgi:hypothetical protein
MIDPEDWLAGHAYGYSELGSSERQAIAHFALLWSFFELRVMNKNATVPSILAKVVDWTSLDVFNVETFVGPLNYFEQRYYRDGHFTQLFAGLNFKRNDHRILVERVLNGETRDVSDIVGALLLIVVRLRNNLFHGEKWEYGIREQEANFVNASQVLMLVMDPP